MASSFTSFLGHTQRRTTFGRTPLDEWSARRRDLYLTAHNTHNRQKSMPPGGIRTHSLRMWAAAYRRLRARGHWDRRIVDVTRPNFRPASVFFLPILYFPYHFNFFLEAQKSFTCSHVVTLPVSCKLLNYKRTKWKTVFKLMVPCIVIHS